MKRIIRQSITLILLIITIIVFICYLYIRNRVKFNDLLINQDEYDYIISNRKKYNGEFIDKIIFNNNPLFDVSDTNEYFYSMVEKDNNKYNPFIKYNSDNNLKISILDNKITDELIANNDHIKLLAYNDEYYKEYEIIVTTLPIMNISYEDNEENNDKLNLEVFQLRDENLDSTVDGLFYLFDNSNNTVQNNKISFHVRGGMSTMYAKKGLKLSLKDDTGKKIDKKLLNMREDDDWILQADYSDQDMVRNEFASRLWYDLFSNRNQFGIKAGNYYKYVELFMNGKYHGLYSLGFPIDEKQLNITGDGLIYKKFSYFDEKTELSLDNNGITIAYELKNKNASNESFDYLKKFFYNLVNAYTSSDIYDSIDKENIYNYYIFSNFIQHVDNSKNLIIANKYNDDKLIFFYIPWDMDMILGNIWDADSKNQIAQYKVDYNDNGTIVRSTPVEYLYNLDYDDTINNIKNYYQKMIDNNFTKDYINKIIDEYENDIFKSGAYNRNIKNWPSGNQSSSISDLTKFKEYVNNRYDSFYKYISSL